ncbi:MAG: S8 family serine peptidase, partial [Halobacteriales archaeon]|nr:S8 family serine peptidase [Halobacteriales archaeon]
MLERAAAPAARRRQDAQGHGTRVAGVLAGDGAQSPGQRYRGVAPGAHLVALDIGQRFTLDGALQAMDWLHANAQPRGIRVVSSSWGVPGAVDGRFDPEDPLVQASDALAQRGLLLVFSAGNRGAPHSMASAALNPHVLTIGATDAGGQLAPFSSQGPGLDAQGARLAWRKPDLVAVGQAVVSAKSGAGQGDAEDRSLAPLLYGQA